jgi:hypothetical protein
MKKEHIFYFGCPPKIVNLHKFHFADNAAFAKSTEKKHSGRFVKNAKNRQAFPT